ncbi:WxL domain-containing protein [Enterococcus gallinarum]|uniref:WxL domain-containing protein n=1 Tax=Enterococcus gallinarum TaxID=1353 RepID=UPI00214CB082|nr:WxL domain-containing protein [Enterococcus gallinarum]MCR1928067.1 WxL domain-containing protein [Enterococcus gallinarum]
MKKHIALFSTTLLLASFLGGARAFAEEQNDATPNSAETTVTGELQLSDKGGFNPNPPSNDLHTKNEISEGSYFGIAYQPNSFNIGNVPLADSTEEQNIVFQGPDGSNKHFHVAVKDKTRSDKRTWSLKAKIETAIESPDLGINIKTGTTANSVQRNMNNGSDEFKGSDLVAQIQKDGSNKEVVNDANVVIGTQDVVVMKAQNGKFVNGAYDLKLPQVELNIPNPDKVKAQVLNTKVVWTLSDTPE